jgi:hypothetical protein
VVWKGVCRGPEVLRSLASSLWKRLEPGGGSHCGSGQEVCGEDPVSRFPSRLRAGRQRLVTPHPRVSWEQDQWRDQVWREQDGVLEAGKSLRAKCLYRNETPDGVGLQDPHRTDMRPGGD